MANKDDRRAALLLLLLALAGAAVRFAGTGGGSPGSIGYQVGSGARPPRDSLQAAADRLSRPLEDGERIDVDRAGVNDLARLPRVGPGLARRIIGDRERRGPFGSLEAVGRVSGVGDAVLDAIRPYTMFSGRPRVPRDSGLDPRIVSLNTATAAELQQLPGIGPTKAAAIVEDRRRNGRYRVIEDLGRVPGIGPATIERIRNRVSVR